MRPDFFEHYRLLKQNITLKILFENKSTLKKAKTENYPKNKGKNGHNFFPQLTGIDKIHFRFSEQISHKKHFFSALSNFFLTKPVFLLVSTGLLSFKQQQTTY